jgi:hypothetical protein
MIGPITNPPYCKNPAIFSPNGGYAKKKDMNIPIAAQVTQGFRKLTSKLRNTISVLSHAQYNGVSQRVALATASPQCRTTPF